MSDSTVPKSQFPLPASVFVGRDEHLAAFRDLLEAELDRPPSVLVFQGPPGCGKSTLLRVLHSIVAELAPPVPHAWFNLKSLTDRAQAYREVLVSWRATLQESFGLRFPRFDLCLMLILAGEADDESPLLAWCPDLAPLYELAQALLERPEIAVETLNADSRPDVHIALSYWIENDETGQPRINGLCQRVAAGNCEVASELLQLFAADLSEGLWVRPGKAVRGVLFLDSYDSLIPPGGLLPEKFVPLLDWWVRELAAYCLTQGVLLVVVSEIPLNWPAEDGEWNPHDLVQLPLNGLSPREAQDFLARCGIGPVHPEAPSSLQRAVMRAASPSGGGGLLNQWANRQLDECSPLWLALGADVVRLHRLNKQSDPGASAFALVSAAQPGRKLCDLLLKTLPQGADSGLVEAALAPRCDDASTSLSSGEIGLSWEQFVEFSFLEDQGDGFWRVHPAVRQELLLTRRPDELLAEHLSDFHHWNEVGEPHLALFHQWRLDAAEALAQWSRLHAEAMAQGAADRGAQARARALLTTWSELKLDERELETVEPRTLAKAHLTLAVAHRETPFLAPLPSLAIALSHLEAALGVFTADEWPREWVEAQIETGRTWRALGRAVSGVPTKEEYFEAALESCRAALAAATPQKAPKDWALVQMEMAAAHRELLALDVHGTGPHNHLQRAISCYEQALRLYDEGRHPVEWAEIQTEMGKTYASSEAGGRLRNLKRARKCFEESLRFYSERDTPLSWADATSRLGQILGELSSGDRTENLRGALTCYVGALRVFSEDDHPAEYAQTQLLAGLAWGDLAYLSDEPSAMTNAVNYIETAAECFQKIGALGEAAKARDTAADIRQSLQKFSAR